MVLLEAMYHWVAAGYFAVARRSLTRRNPTSRDLTYVILREMHHNAKLCELIEDKRRWR